MVKKKMQLPNNLQKVMEITERYFRKHGEIKPTLVCFKNEGFTIDEHEVDDELDTYRVADQMVAAAVDGASAVAFVAEAWCGLSTPSSDPNRQEALLIGYEQPQSVYNCICDINRQRYGAPRLAKWRFHTRQGARANAGRMECIFERARIRVNTSLACDVSQPRLMLVMNPDGECLANSSGEVLIVSSLLMARESIERWSDGGEYRCVTAADHLDKIVGGRFHLTGAEAASCQVLADGDLKTTIELIEEIMKLIRNRMA
jgi:hypothetical protein